VSKLALQADVWYNDEVNIVVSGGACDTPDRIRLNRRHIVNTLPHYAHKSKPSLSERFWSKVDKSGECWVWTATCYRNGYGQFGPEHGKGVLAHRFAWELIYGAIPNGLLVCHHCDNPACVRPDHLFLGTQSDNMKDCAAKGRSSLQNPAKHHRKLTEIQVQEIRQLSMQGVSKYRLARRYHVTETTIGQIVSGRTWTHLTDAPLLDVPLEDPMKAAAKVTIGEAIRADRARGMTLEQLARKYHIANGRIGPIARGELWK